MFFCGAFGLLLCMFVCLFAWSCYQYAVLQLPYLLFLLFCLSLLLCFVLSFCPSFLSCLLVSLFPAFFLPAFGFSFFFSSVFAFVRQSFMFYLRLSFFSFLSLSFSCLCFLSCLWPPLFLFFNLLFGSIVSVSSFSFSPFLPCVHFCFLFISLILFS